MEKLYYHYSISSDDNQQTYCSHCNSLTDGHFSKQKCTVENDLEYVSLYNDFKFCARTWSGRIFLIAFKGNWINNTEFYVLKIKDEQMKLWLEMQLETLLHNPPYGEFISLPKKIEDIVESILKSGQGTLEKTNVNLFSTNDKEINIFYNKNYKSKMIDKPQKYGLY